MSDDYLWIETEDALKSLCEELRACEWLALDTEFMRERTYYPQLCLVQIATPNVVACVDVLAIKSLDPLFVLLQNPNSVKVMHSARQDLEMFFHLSGQVPAPIFDTQLAASFAGLPDQAGYASVVQALLGVTLEKSHTRADWARRPLAAAVLQYAADDVRYLRDIYVRLKQTLETQGRLKWLEADNAVLTDPATYRPDPETVWQRLHGLQRLKSRQFAAAKMLAAWRERQAMSSNLPRQWIFKDEVLMDLARQLPTSMDGLSSIRGMQEGLIRKHGDELIALMTSAHGDAKPAQAPEHLSARDEALVDALMAVVRIKGSEAGVSPAQLATRHDLEQLVRGQRDLDVLKSWRLETAGRALIEFMQGKTRLAISDGVLGIHPVD
ncbi:MAG TPA: ribonuclease D [Gammaproteobacteria bacterium]|nr:ribonuclease D [Gammaproteobacteria bacterium]